MASPAPTPDAQTSASALAEVKRVYSPTGIGFMIATAAYGIGVLQCYLYLRNYPKDSIVLKIIVVVMLVIDTAATALMAFTVYDNSITHFGDLAYAAIINPVVVLLSLTSFAIGIFLTYHIGHFTEIASLATRTIRIASGMNEGTLSLCDVLIATTLIYVLRSKRMEGVSSTERMIDTLILYIITRGLLTAIIQLMYLAVGLAFPDQLYWQPFRQILGKLYVNSVLASLNVRQSVRGKGQPENFGEVVLSNLPTGSFALNKSTVVFATPHSISRGDTIHRDEDTLGPHYYKSDNA
ncbi:hypothetical protein C8R44DRAFT_865196 [Mycena epipterygia]|nr:hypothetical protein C8R44DRAFT_865196 [Mycena epipterygia]